MGWFTDVIKYQKQIIAILGTPPEGKTLFEMISELSGSGGITEEQLAALNGIFGATEGGPFTSLDAFIEALGGLQGSLDELLGEEEEIPW